MRSPESHTGLATPVDEVTMSRRAARFRSCAHRDLNPSCAPIEYLTAEVESHAEKAVAYRHCREGIRCANWISPNKCIADIKLKIKKAVG